MKVHDTDIIISKDKDKLDIDYIHTFLKSSYWANTRTRQQVITTIEHCICFGIYIGSQQIGFARVLTDHVTFAYLMDVFVDESYRGMGIASLLMETILNDSDFEDIGKWSLGTRDAHALYKKFGFTSMAKPETWMERLKDNDHCRD